MNPETHRPVLSDHINAVRDALEAQLALLSGDTPNLKVGCHSAPPGSENDPAFFVIRPMPGGSLDGDLEHSQRETQFVFQVLGVSQQTTTSPALEDTAIKLIDIARKVLRRDTITVPGRVVQNVMIAEDIAWSGATFRDDDLANPNYYARDRYTLWTTPS